MKKILFILILASVQIAWAKTKIMACPKKDKALSAVTYAQPGSLEDFKRKGIQPPNRNELETWDLAPFTDGGKKKLFLSCASTRGFIMSKRIPIDPKRHCKVIDATTDLKVQCDL